MPIVLLMYLITRWLRKLYFTR